MKKVFFKMSIMTLLAVFTLTVVPQVAYAQKVNMQLQKQLNKEYKSTLKRFQKEGWKLSGSSRSIEVVLLTHYEKLNDEKNKEIVGQVSQCQSINICSQFALNNAQVKYAKLASAKLSGSVATMQRGDAIKKEEVDKFIGAYETAVEADVSSALTPSFSIVKDNKDGTKSYETYFILDEEKAGIARKRAFEQSLKETGILLKEMDEVGKFVKETVEIAE